MEFDVKSGISGATMRESESGYSATDNGAGKTEILFRSGVKSGTAGRVWLAM